MRESATILKVLHHFCRMSPGWEKPWDFQHKSTFVNLILEKIAKGAWFRIKKLSYFRLENYKLYAPCGEMSNQIVENSVENVKFHRENRLCSRTFELSPPGFQHGEKIGSFYGMYSPQKLFGPQVPAGAEGAAARDNFSQKTGPGAGKPQCPVGPTKKRQFAGKPGRLMLYFTLDYHLIKSSGWRCRASGAVSGTCITDRSDRNGRRT